MQHKLACSHSGGSSQLNFFTFFSEEMLDIMSLLPLLREIPIKNLELNRLIEEDYECDSNDNIDEREHEQMNLSILLSAIQGCNSLKLNRNRFSLASLSALTGKLSLHTLSLDWVTLIQSNTDLQGAEHEKAYRDVWILLLQQLNILIAYPDLASNLDDLCCFWRGLCYALCWPGMKQLSRLTCLEAGFSSGVPIDIWTLFIEAICEVGNLECIKVQIWVVPKNLEKAPLCLKTSASVCRRGIRALGTLLAKGGQQCRDLSIDIPLELSLDALWAILAECQLPVLEKLRLSIFRDKPRESETDEKIERDMTTFFFALKKLQCLKVYFNTPPDGCERTLSNGASFSVLNNEEIREIKFYATEFSTAPTAKQFSFCVYR
jgi:hypothetical protein